MKKKCFVLLMMFLLIAANVWASGFRVPEQGAASMGMSNAWVATADDPTAISMNPAGIAQIGSPAISAGFLLINPSAERTAKDGTKEEVESNLFITPSLFATCNMGTSNWVFGIGVSTPFGLGTEWADDSFARYVSTLTEIELVNVNPTLAYKVNDNLFLGAGLDYYRSTVTLKKRVPWGLVTYSATGDPAALALPDGGFKMEGDGDGWGFNAGLLYKFGGKYSFGLAYRSGVTVDYDGDAELSDISGAGLMLGGTTFKTSGAAEVDYPAMVQVGLAAEVIPALVLEFDIEWTGWSSYDKLAIDFENDNAILQDTESIKDWDDTITYRLGLEYAASEVMDIRAGYLYDKSPIPDEHFDTLLPDSESRHGVTLGLGYSFGQLTLDTSILALWGTERTINQTNVEYASNPTIDLTGDYDSFTWLFALNLDYLF